jgi:hypothetical protein
MGSKAEPGKFDCYANALPDEPMFILLARDPDFHRLVMKWARRRSQDIQCGLRPDSDMTMVAEAQECAFNGRKWRKENNGKWRK